MNWKSDRMKHGRGEGASGTRNKRRSNNGNDRNKHKMYENKSTKNLYWHTKYYTTILDTFDGPEERKQLELKIFYLQKLLI